MYNTPLYNSLELLGFISAGLVEGVSILHVFYFLIRIPVYLLSHRLAFSQRLRAAGGDLDPLPKGLVKLNHVSMSLF